MTKAVTVDRDLPERQTISLSVDESFLVMVQRLQSQLDEAGVGHAGKYRKKLNRTETIRIVLDFVTNDIPLSQLVHFAKARAKEAEQRRAHYQRELRLRR